MAVRDAPIREHTRQKGKPLLLLYILAETNGREGPPISEIAELMELCPRQVKRLIRHLEEAGELKVTRGAGRGHPSTYMIPYLKVTRKGDINGDTPGAEKGRAPAQTWETKGDINGDTPEGVKGDAGDGMSPFGGELKGDIGQPPHTPHKDNYLSTVGANAPTAPHAVSKKSYVGGLLQFRESELGTRLPNHKMEAAAAAWLYEQDWPFEDAKACYQFLKAQKWRETPVTLKTVMSSIGDWKKGNLNDDDGGQGREKRGNGRDDPARRDAKRDQAAGGQWRFKNSA